MTDPRLLTEVEGDHGDVEEDEDAYPCLREILRSFTEKRLVQPFGDAEAEEMSALLGELVQLRAECYNLRQDHERAERAERIVKTAWRTVRPRRHVARRGTASHCASHPETVAPLPHRTMRRSTAAATRRGKPHGFPEKRELLRMVRATLSQFSPTPSGEREKPWACPQCDSGDITKAYRQPPGTWKCQTCGAVWQTKPEPTKETS